MSCHPEAKFFKEYIHNELQQRFDSVWALTYNITFKIDNFTI